MLQLIDPLKGSFKGSMLQLIHSRAKTWLGVRHSFLLSSSKDLMLIINYSWAKKLFVRFPTSHCSCTNFFRVSPPHFSQVVTKITFPHLLNILWNRRFIQGSCYLSILLFLHPPKSGLLIPLRGAKLVRFYTKLTDYLSKVKVMCIRLDMWCRIINQCLKLE